MAPTNRAMSEVLRNAYGLHRAGRLAEAARAYDEIITADPLQFDAHFLLGLIHLQSGRFLEAEQVLCDALWVGVPVLTCIGQTFAGRVAASLLTAMGLPELITTSLEDYQTRAHSLAKDNAELARLKTKLVKNRDIPALFDTARITRDLEAAYREMWERQQRGEAPRSFTVERAMVPASS